MSLVIKFDPDHSFDDGSEKWRPVSSDNHGLGIHSATTVGPVGGPNVHRWKTITQNRMNNKEIRVPCGDLAISIYEDFFGLASPHAFVFQAEKRQVPLKLELQEQQGLIGRRLRKASFPQPSS